jgi:hypothetical protein
MADLEEHLGKHTPGLFPKYQEIAAACKDLWHNAQMQWYA